MSSIAILNKQTKDAIESLMMQDFPSYPDACKAYLQTYKKGAPLPEMWKAFWEEQAGERGTLPDLKKKTFTRVLVSSELEYWKAVEDGVFLPSSPTP